MAEKDIMEILDDAIGAASDGAPDPNSAVEGEEPTGRAVGEGGDDDADLLDGLDEPRVAAEGDEAAEGEEAVDAEGNALHRDPETGRFIKKPEETPEEKVAREAAELAAGGKPDAKGGKKPDPLNDPIPKDLAQPTQERIRSLISTAKDTARERDEIRQNFDFMVNGIQATGTTVEQYGELLSFMALFNSGDPKQQEQALSLLEDVADRLANLLGKERVIKDPLEQHKDLQADVAANKLSLERAKEIARGRNQAQFRGQLNETAQQQQTREQQTQREYAEAKAGLTALEKTLIGTDKDYMAKRQLMVPILKAVLPTIPHKFWVKAFENAYRNIRLPQARVRPRSSTGSQPIRPNRQPGGRQAPQANDGLDVINQALENMGSR
jgi:hypothetical protein